VVEVQHMQFIAVSLRGHGLIALSQNDKVLLIRRQGDLLGPAHAVELDLLQFARIKWIGFNIVNREAGISSV
jgi:hypothetical protein